MKMNNWFLNDELVEMTKKNMEYTMDLFKTSMKDAEEMTNKGVKEYFNHLNRNIDYLNKTYEEASKKGEEVVAIYKENAEKMKTAVESLIENINKTEEK